MRTRLLAFVPLLLAGCGVGSSTEPADPEGMLGRACAYLTSQQAEDGGWHSQTYGLARSGQAWTPFVLHALLEASESHPSVPRPDVGRALDFIRRHINEEGVLGLADPDVPEYPNYATAFALRSVVRVGREEDQPLVERMRSFLAAEQFQAENGYDETSLAYGSWGFGGPRPEGSPGHLGLSTPGTFSRRSGRRGFPIPTCTNGRRRSCGSSSDTPPIRDLNLRSPKSPTRTSRTMAGSISRPSFSRPTRARSSKARTARTSRVTPALLATVCSRSWKQG